MVKTAKRSRWFVLSAAAVSIVTSLVFSTKAVATPIPVTTPMVRTNTFDGGKIETRLGSAVSEDSHGNQYLLWIGGGQFSHNYIFDDPVWNKKYAYVYGNMADTATIDLEGLGQTSGLGFLGHGDADFTQAINESYEYEVVDGKNEYTYKATLSYPYGSHNYKLDYKVVTTMDDEGAITHNATVTNVSGANINLPDGLGMLVDTKLYSSDFVPLYAAKDHGKAVYMDLTKGEGNPEPEVQNGKKLRFELEAGTNIEKMWAGNYSKFKIGEKRNVEESPEGEVLTRNDAYNPQNPVPGVWPYWDSAVWYEIAGTENLVNGGSVQFSYKEKLKLMSAGNISYEDESGQILGQGEETKIYEQGKPLDPIDPPYIPGYSYQHAEMYRVDELTGEETPSPNLYTDDAHTNKADRTRLTPVTGIAPGRKFKIKLIYRPVTNKDTIGGATANTDTDKTPGNNKPGTGTNPETDQNTGNTIQVPATAAKKGEAVYAVNKLGLYKGVNFTNSSRIKAYAKKTRVNRPQFIVKGYAYSKSGALRYLVQQYNPRTNKYVVGTKGYITASRKYVKPVYYKATGTKRLKVINANGVKAYGNKQLTKLKKAYKKGATLKVKRVVKQKYTTRFQLTNGLYVTGSKKFVMFK